MPENTMMNTFNDREDLVVTPSKYAKRLAQDLSIPRYDTCTTLNNCIEFSYRKPNEAW